MAPKSIQIRPATTPKKIENAAIFPRFFIGTLADLLPLLPAVDHVFRRSVATSYLPPRYRIPWKSFQHFWTVRRLFWRTSLCSPIEVMSSERGCSLSSVQRVQGVVQQLQRSLSGECCGARLRRRSIRYVPLGPLRFKVLSSTRWTLQKNQHLARFPKILSMRRMPVGEQTFLEFLS